MCSDLDGAPAFRRLSQRPRVAARTGDGATPSRQPAFRPALLVVVFLLAAACQREQRSFPDASSARRPQPTRVSGLQPGKSLGSTTAAMNPYEGNAQAISEGQRLFEQYNCSGCHFHGGGGIGPALMDEEWTYGNSPANIYASITEGRPNGMPSYGGHLPDFQVWQIVTYVRSVGGLEPRTASQPRSDEMQARRAEEPK